MMLVFDSEIAAGSDAFPPSFNAQGLGPGERGRDRGEVVQYDGNPLYCDVINVSNLVAMGFFNPLLGIARVQALEPSH